jgi:tRNA G37 N-methylase TrmD
MFPRAPTIRFLVFIASSFIGLAEQVIDHIAKRPQYSIGDQFIAIGEICAYLSPRHEKIVR